MRIAPLALAALACAVTACQPQAGPLSAADEQAITAADNGISTSVNAGNADGTAAAYASDGTIHPNGGPAVVGGDAIKKMWSDFLGSSRVSLRLSGQKVAGQGDLAYLTGNYHIEITPKDSTQAKPPAEDGKYLMVWKRQADKSWKAVAESWNPNAGPPMPAPAPAAPARRH